VKRHLLADGRGVPLSVLITGANVHDKWLVGQVLDAIVARGPRGPRRPKNLCLDKGYDYADSEGEVRSRRIKPHIRRRGEQPLLGCVRGRPRRWVVERSFSWLNRFRALLIRWERNDDNHLALLHLGCGFIAYQQAGGRW
jgi:transposase